MAAMVLIGWLGNMGIAVLLHSWLLALVVILGLPALMSFSPEGMFGIEGVATAIRGPLILAWLAAVALVVAITGGAVAGALNREDLVQDRWISATIAVVCAGMAALRAWY